MCLESAEYGSFHLKIFGVRFKFHFFRPKMSLKGADSNAQNEIAIFSIFSDKK